MEIDSEMGPEPRAGARGFGPRARGSGPGAPGPGPVCERGGDHEERAEARCSEPKLAEAPFARRCGGGALRGRGRGRGAWGSGAGWRTSFSGARVEDSAHSQFVDPRAWKAAPCRGRKRSCRERCARILACCGCRVCVCFLFWLVCLLSLLFPSSLPLRKHIAARLLRGFDRAPKNRKCR